MAFQTHCIDGEGDSDESQALGVGASRFGRVVCGCRFGGAGLDGGQVAPMSGAEASQGRAYAQGMRLYFDQVNKAGGVQGQPVEAGFA